jgi:hypothetical protein
VCVEVRAVELVETAFQGVDRGIGTAHRCLRGYYESRSIEVRIFTQQKGATHSNG